jgi:uncharacterized membrane protein required for colicin V production
MTILDWVLVVVWVGVSLSGFWKGAVKLVFGLGGLAVGLWLAFAIGDDLALHLESSVPQAWIAATLGALLPILAAVVLFSAAGWGIDRTLKALKLGWANRLAGAALAGATGGVLMGFLLVLSFGISPEWAEMCRESMLVPYFVDLADFVFRRP